MRFWKIKNYKRGPPGTHYHVCSVSNKTIYSKISRSETAPTFKEFYENKYQIYLENEQKIIKVKTFDIYQEKKNYTKNLILDLSAIHPFSSRWIPYEN